jgi:hypothetical protein
MSSILQPAINMKLFQIPVIFYTPKPFLQIQASNYHIMQEHGHFLPLLKANTHKHDTLN